MPPQDVSVSRSREQSLHAPLRLHMSAKNAQGKLELRLFQVALLCHSESIRLFLCTHLCADIRELREKRACSDP